MEFYEKLQALRKQKGLTQEELGERLYVSRAAISKWESGRGYPNLDSLKGIAKLFGITIDELLSCDELLYVAEQDGKQKEKHLRNLVFGLLDIGTLLLLFLPFFSQKIGETIYAVSLLELTEKEFYIKTVYFAVTVVSAALGILQLTLQNNQSPFWLRNKERVSLILNVLGVILFCASLQPYATVLLFAFLTIKIVMLIKQ